MQLDSFEFVLAYLKIHMHRSVIDIFKHRINSSLLLQLVLELVAHVNELGLLHLKPKSVDRVLCTHLRILQSHQHNFDIFNLIPLPRFHSMAKYKIFGVVINYM